MSLAKTGIPIVCDVVGYLAIAVASILAEPLTYLFRVADASLAEESTAAVEGMVATGNDLTVDSGEKCGPEMIDQGYKSFVWNGFTGSRFLPFLCAKLLHDGAASLLFLFVGHYRMGVVGPNAPGSATRRPGGMDRNRTAPGRVCCRSWLGVGVMIVKSCASLA